MSSGRWLILRSLTAALLIPGVVAGILPYLIARPVVVPSLADWRFTHYGAALTCALGLTIFLWCTWQFAHSGRGTLAPFDEPRSIVVQGPYRFVRNPMYIGVLFVLLGESWFLSSVTLLAYTGFWFLIVNVFVLAYEEPNLRSKHGADYEHYCGAVRRWLPGPAYRRGENAGAASHERSE